MKPIILFSTAIFFYTTNSAQDSTSGKPTTGKPYTLHVVKTDGSVLKAFLYEATPSGISVTKSTKEPTPSNTITPEQINKLYLRRKGNVGRGLLLGAIGGTAIGALIGASKAPDEGTIITPEYTTQEKTVTGATIGFFSGAGLGLIIGALTKKKFIIQGKKENYQLSYPAIVERAMVQHQ